jgi:hypothetical protein
MCPADDIPLDNPNSPDERADSPKPAEPRREVGPESEVRGGPEASDDQLDDNGDEPA